MDGCLIGLELYIVIDCRCLVRPHFVPEIRVKSVLSIG